MTAAADGPSTKVQLWWTLDIMRAANLATADVLAPAAAYAALTPLNALAEGASWLLLVSLFAGGTDAAFASSGALASVASRLSIPPGGTALLAAVTLLFGLKALLTIGLSTLEAYLAAIMRRRVQEACVKTLMHGLWSSLARQNVGRWVGAMTEETAWFIKILTSSLQASYCAVTFGVLMGLAFTVENRLSLLVAAVGGPLWLALRWIYRHQTRLSLEQARQRQGFASDVNERLSGLFQIKAGGETAAQLALGLRHQEALMRYEVRVGRCYGLLNAVNPLLFTVMLGAFTAWTLWSGTALETRIAALGSVGILALRAAGQLNNLIANIGNLSRLSGCLEPLRRVLLTPPEPERAPLPEPLAGLRFEDVSFSFDGRHVLRSLSLGAKPGRLLLVSGPSGSGKTTLANLLAGLLHPDAGQVLYLGVSGKKYPASRYRARIGYVPQDVHLFSGTVRENLDPEGRLEDTSLWESLASAGAKDFVTRLGGLAAPIAEAGRSLSGGEKRRLAIAKALARKSDCLVLDEITNGLDGKAKTTLVETVGALARERLVVAISHDLAAFSSLGADKLEMGPAKGRVAP